MTEDETVGRDRELIADARRLAGDQEAEVESGASVTCPHCQATLRVQTVRDGLDCTECGSRIDGSTLGAEKDLRPAKQIAHFQLVEHLGEGQFGAVWKALDTQLDRLVALKIPRRHRIEQEDVDRFMREARAAAQLKHPNLVAIHAVGRDSGTVYIATELIEGVDLKQWSIDHRPTPDQAAELCATVADAIHHAHQNGVVHRDLKPANIMMDLRSQPHITDFGLAKRDSGEATMTLEGQLLGTPAYMSPEQVRGQSHQADARTDVYSLGVILFQLLTGELPFRGESRMLLVQILQDDPPRPRRLNSQTPRDLETICLKCLEKTPGRRYADARQLGDDLRRWSRNEPIHARPAGRAERAMRWCQRRPAVTALVAGLVASITLGFGGVAWQWRKTVTRFEEAQVQRKRADDNLQALSDTVFNMLIKVGSDRLADEPSLAPVRRELIDEGLRYYDTVIQRQDNSAAGKLRYAEVLYRVAMLRHWRGEFEPAEKQFQRALDSLESLRSTAVDEAARRMLLVQCRRGLGHVLVATGQGPAGIETFQAALEQLEWFTTEDIERQLVKARILIDLGNVFESQGGTVKAESTYAEAVVHAQAVFNQDPARDETRITLAIARHLLARTYQDTGKFDRADGLFASALETMEPLLADNTPSNLHFASNLLTDYGMYLEFAERHEEATILVERALEVRRRLASNTTAPEYRRELAVAVGNRAWLVQSQQTYDQAIVLFREAESHWRQLTAQYPISTDFLRGLANTQNNLGMTLNKADRHAEAELTLRDANDAARQLNSLEPRNAVYHSLVANINENLANALVDDDGSGRRPCYERAVEHQREAMRLDPENREYPRYLTIHLLGVARSADALHDGDAVKRSLHDAWQCVVDLRARASDNRTHSACSFLSGQIAWNLLTLSHASLENGPNTVELARDAHERFPDQPGFQLTLGAALCRAGQYDDARSTLESLQEMDGWHGPSADYLVAMCQWHNGDETAARTLAERAGARLDGFDLPPTHLVWRLQAECAALVGD